MINIDNLVNGTYCTGNIKKKYVAPKNGINKKHKNKSKFKFNIKVLEL